MTAGDWIWVVGCMLGGYLIGAIPFGLLVAAGRGIDIRKHGSGNIGATNVGRVCGRKWGILVFLLDGLKGLGPVLVSGWILLTFRQLDPRGAAGAWAYVAWIGVAAGCILGHMFPIYLKFQGGKGVATSLGALLGIWPYFTLLALIAFVAWGVVLAITRYVSLASIVAAILLPVLLIVGNLMMIASWGGAGLTWPLHLFAWLIAGLVVYRHRGNIQRLRQGTESRIG